MTLDANYQEIRELAAKFADAELMPRAEKIDKEGVIPEEVYKMMAENGFFGIFIPEEYGGAGMDYMDYSIIVEEISRGCASSGVVLSAHNSLAVWPILNYGNEEQKKKYLPKMASGEWVGCFCLSEPNAGSDAGSLTTYAEDKGDHWEISGTKNFITNGKEAGVAVVFAKTEKAPGHKSMCAFIVETASEGFQISKLEDKLGIKGSSTAQIFLDKVKVPKENLLGAAGKGFSIGLGTLDGGRIGIGAQALGIARASFEYAAKYTTERVQFGKPISDKQGVQFILADMSTKIAASRLLIYHASHLKNAKVPYGKEAAQAKLFASEAGMWITTKGIQLLGGVGFTKEYPAERHFRDAKICEIYEGTSEIQRLVIAAHELKGLS